MLRRAPSSLQPLYLCQNHLLAYARRVGLGRVVFFFSSSTLLSWRPSRLRKCYNPFQKDSIKRQVAFTGLGEPSPDQITPVSEAKSDRASIPSTYRCLPDLNRPFFFFIVLNTDNLWTGGRGRLHARKSPFSTCVFHRNPAPRRRSGGKPPFTQSKSLLRTLPRTLATSRSLLAARELSKRFSTCGNAAVSSREARVLAEELGFPPASASPCLSLVPLAPGHAAATRRGVQHRFTLLSAPSRGQEPEDESCYEPTPSITRPRGTSRSCLIPPRYSAEAAMGGGVFSGSPPLTRVSPSPGSSRGSVANAPGASGCSSPARIPALKFSGGDGTVCRWPPSAWGGPLGTSG